MPEGYCTLEDVRRALREADLPGDLSQDTAIAVDAVAAQTEWLEKTLKRHWYAPTGADILDEATDIDIPTAPKTRDDEYDIPTASAFVPVDEDESPPPKTSQGTYAKIDLARRDAQSISEFLVRTGDGSYEDWTSTYTGGSWPNALGDDYYLRVNNGGWSRLYLDTENLLIEDDDVDDEYVLDSWANAVYLTFDYGHENIPRTVRRAVALRSAAHFTEEAAIQIPDNAKVYDVQSKAEQMREKATELLEVYR
jgi:hypothetical protein